MRLRELRIAAAALTLGVVSASRSQKDLPLYCSKTDTEAFSKAREVPELSADARVLNPTLLQAQVLVRHGARAPASFLKCWKGYDPSWDCNLTTNFLGHCPSCTAGVPSSSRQRQLRGGLLGLFAGNEDAKNFRTMLFEKKYDADTLHNVFNGTCQKGQLLNEGFLQHKTVGENLADAYLIGNSKPLFTVNDLEEKVYLRSTDMQRTVVSAATVFTEMISRASWSHNSEAPVIHTVDMEGEYLYPNMAVCPTLRHLREEFASSLELKHLNAKYAPLKERLIEAVELDSLRDIWPGGIFDCIMTTICTEQFEQFPPALRGDASIVGYAGASELLDLVQQAVDEYANVEFTWQDSSYAKASSLHFWIEVKSQMLKKWMSVVPDFVLEGKEEETPMGPRKGAEDLIKYTKAKATRQDRPGGDPKSFVLYAAHDTTVMPFLASLGTKVYDGLWPPYASEVILELYRLVSKTDARPYFRLIYNGENLTPRVGGCASTKTPELCPLSELFASTAWAVPSNVEEICSVSVRDATDSHDV